MTFTATETEKLECKYCKINLAEQAVNGIGFVTCPDCLRTYLKLPQTAKMETNTILKTSSRKILDLFIDPSIPEQAIQELKEKVQIQEENITSLKSIQETIISESNQEKLSLLENLKSAQETLEEVNILNQDLKASLDEANLEMKRIQGVIAEKNQLVIKLKKELDETIETLRQKENLYEILEKENGYKSLSLANVNNDALELKKLCSVYEEKIAILESELKNDKNRLTELNLSLAVIPDLEIELDKAHTQISDLQRALEIKEQDTLHEMGGDHIVILNDEINALKNDIKDYVATISELQSKLSSQDVVIKSKETEIYTLHHQTQELVKATPAAIEDEQANLFSNYESDEIIKLRDRVRRFEQTEQKLENMEIELEISRDELSKAQKEIVGLNSLLEKAFYENQKSQVEVAPVQSEKLVNVARDIEKREDDLMEYTYELNKKIDSFMKTFEGFRTLTFDVAIIREDSNGRVVSPLFSKGTLLPVGDMELKKVITYKTTLNKGLIYFKHEDDRNVVLNDLRIDFSSNNLFFLNEEEFNALEVSEVVVEIREEYSLNSEGELSLAFYRNNGFKRFDSKVGKLIAESVQGVEKIVL